MDNLGLDIRNKVQFIPQDSFHDIESIAFIECITMSSKLHKLTNETKGLCLILIQKGQGTFYLENQVYGIKANDLFIVSDLKEFYVSGKNIELAYLYIRSRAFTEDIKLFDIQYTIDQINSFTIGFYNLKRAMEKERTHEFLSMYFNILSELKYNVKNKFKTRKFDNPIDYAKYFIQNNFDKEIHIDDLCKKVNFSKYYFIRLFKEETGLSPYQYLIKTRITYSKFMLEHTSHLIKDIAKMSGFNSELTFIHSFKKLENTTPSSYRKLRGAYNDGKTDNI